jgi:hypothetical protein
LPSPNSKSSPVGNPSIKFNLYFDLNLSNTFSRITQKLPNSRMKHSNQSASPSSLLQTTYSHRHRTPSPPSLKTSLHHNPTSSTYCRPSKANTPNPTPATS